MCVKDLRSRPKFLIVIVIGCESHLDNSFSSQEIFPPQYVVMRKDHCIGGGGVFLALKNHLTFAEMAWVKLRMCIYVCSLY